MPYIYHVDLDAFTQLESSVLMNYRTLDTSTLPILKSITVSPCKEDYHRW
jgi:hypothetical protein